MRSSIDTLRIPDLPGRLGLVPCPGRGGLWSIPDPEAPSAADSDLQRYVEWGAGGLVTLVESGELLATGLADLDRRAQRAGMDWYHLPIMDFCAPDRRFEAAWQRHGDELLRRLREGEHLIVHCLAGLGRTGTVAARILIECGVAPADAVQRVRRARPGTIQSSEQLAWVLETQWR